MIMKKIKISLACLAIAGLFALEFIQTQEMSVRYAQASSSDSWSSSSVLVLRWDNFHYYPTRMMPDSTLVKSASCEAWCHGHPKGLYSYCHSHGLRKCSKNFGEE